MEVAEELPHLEMVMGLAAGLAVGYELWPVTVPMIKSVLSSGSATSKFLANPYAGRAQGGPTELVTQEKSNQNRENYFAWSRAERDEWRHRENCIIG